MMATDTWYEYARVGCVRPWPFVPVRASPSLSPELIFPVNTLRLGLAHRLVGARCAPTMSTRWPPAWAQKECEPTCNIETVGWVGHHEYQMVCWFDEWKTGAAQKYEMPCNAHHIKSPPSRACRSARIPRLSRGHPVEISWS